MMTLITMLTAIPPERLVLRQRDADEHHHEAHEGIGNLGILGHYIAG